MTVRRTDQRGSIKRANKRDGSGIMVLKSNISILQDIKVFHGDRQTGAQCSQGKFFKLERIQTPMKIDTNQKL